MDYVKLIYDNGSYDYEVGTSTEMDILGVFLSSDVGCHKSLFRKWLFDDSLGMGVGGNTTFLEKEGDFVFLIDQYSQETVPTELKMTRQQLSSLLDVWQEKVCKNKPKEVIIKHEDGKFVIETKD